MFFCKHWCMTKYVDVVSKMRSDGTILPLKIIWEDGKEYVVDKVQCIKKAASLKAGGCGIRYTCIISGQQRFLFLEDYKWFVEA